MNKSTQPSHKKKVILEIIGKSDWHLHEGCDIICHIIHPDDVIACADVNPTQRMQTNGISETETDLATRNVFNKSIRSKPEMKIKCDVPRNEDCGCRVNLFTSPLSHENSDCCKGRTWMNCKGLEVSKRSDMVPLLISVTNGFHDRNPEFTFLLEPILDIAGLASGSLDKHNSEIFRSSLLNSEKKGTEATTKMQP